MNPVPQFTKPTCRGSYTLGSACGNCERCAWERGRMSVQPPVEHMPWQQANREYDDGYNAGIAAAIAKLKRIENGVRTYPVDATSPEMQRLADSVNEICHTLIPKLARELGSLFHNPVAPPSE